MITAGCCPVCATDMQRAFTSLVLGKYQVQYFSCRACGLLRTETPHWLDEAYRSAISDADTGLVARNLSNRALLEPLLHRLFDGRGRFLDVSGGYGLLARLLRDVGFDCYTTDPYCENLFARGFEPGAGFKADALFAFEVLEHLHDPRAFLAEVFERYGCRTLVFSTETFSGDVPAKDWWYYAFDGGQHITFYQPQTLVTLAARLGVTYHRLGPGSHLFTPTPLPALSRILLLNPRALRLYSLAVRSRRRRISLTWDDHLAVREGRPDRSHPG